MKMKSVLTVLVMVLAAGQALALDLTAGVTHSDVGLYKDGSGGVLGIGQNILSDPGLVDLTVMVEYVQRGGSQPRYFSHPTNGLVLDDADVLLHQLQTAAFVGRSFPFSRFTPRVYGGASVAIKLSESWTQPEGNTAGVIGYEDTDFILHLGVTMDFTRYFVDARYSFGMTKQLIDTTDPLTKIDGLKAAAEVEDGIGEFEDGAKVSGFQMSLGYRF